MEPIFDSAKLHFEIGGHAYSYAGEPFISVTQALAQTGFIDDRWFTEQAALRGSYVHQLTVLMDEDDLHWPSLEPELLPYATAYHAFKMESGFKPLHSEMPVAHPVYRYAGTLDRIGELNSRGALIDIKSGAVSAWVRMQTALYAATLKDKLDRYALELRRDYTYRLHGPFRSGDDLRVGLAAVTCANWQRAQKGAT